MKKFQLLLLVLLACVGLGSAQKLTVSSTQLVDSTGTTVASATISFAPVDQNGKPMSFRMGGNGQVVYRPVTATVKNGAFSITLPDTSLTNPANVCFAVKLIDNATGASLLANGYNCVQPSTTAGWCTSTTCNFDAYIPTIPALPVVSGNTSGTSSSNPVSSLYFTDSATGARYTITVQSGAWHFVQTQGTASSIYFTDSATGSPYVLSVASGKLTLTAGAGSGSPITGMCFVDSVSGVQESLSVSNGSLTETVGSCSGPVNLVTLADTVLGSTSYALAYTSGALAVTQQ